MMPHRSLFFKRKRNEGVDEMCAKTATPLEIIIALHYWTRATDYGTDAPDFNINAPAVIAQRNQMVEARLLNPTYGEGGRLYMPGPALECYINALCAVPWPMQKWVVP